MSIQAQQSVERSEPGQYTVPAKIHNPELLRSGRSAIVRAAIDLFAQNGFHATPVNAIAERSNLTVGALYKYIRSKHDILFLASEYQTEETEESIARWLESGLDPVSALRGAVGDYARMIDKNRKTLVIVYREMHNLDKEARDYILGQELRVRHGLMALIQRAASPEFRQDREMLTTISENLLLLVHMWAVNHRLYASHQTLDDFIRIQTDLVLTQIGAAEGTEPSAK